MSIEDINRRLERLKPGTRIEYDNPLNLATDWLKAYRDDVTYLLAENQQLVEEVERLQNELSGRNKMDESEWYVIVSGAKMMQSTYPKQSIGWIKIQRLIDQYTDGDRSDDLKEALNKVE